MKKLISLIVAAIIILLTSCNITSNPNSIVGNWWSVPEEEEKDHVYLSISEDMTFRCWVFNNHYSEITDDMVPNYSGHVEYKNGKMKLKIDEIDDIILALVMDQNKPQELYLDKNNILTMKFHIIIDKISKSHLFHLRKVEN